MKISHGIMFTSLCLLMLMVVAPVLHEPTVTDVRSAVPALADETLTNETQPGQLSAFRAESTDGLTVVHLDNPSDAEVTRQVEIHYGSRIVVRSVRVASHTTWNYALLSGIAIVPAEPVTFGPETAYYQMSDKLVVSLSGSRRVEIYASKRAAPSVVHTDVPSSWTYNATTRSLIVISREPIKRMDIFFVHYLRRGTVFIEDTERLEPVAENVRMLEAQRDLFNAAVARFEQEGNELTNQTTLLLQQMQEQQQLNSEQEYALAAQRAAYEERRAEFGQLMFLPPSLAVIAIVIALALIVVWVDILLFADKKVSS